MTNDQLQALIDTLESALAVWPEVEKVGFRKNAGLCNNCCMQTRISWESWIQEMAKSYRGYSGNPEYPIKLKGRDPVEVYSSKANLYTGQYGRNRKNFAKYLVRTAKAQIERNKTMKFNELPAIGKPLAEGIFAGITSTKKGHFAVIKLPYEGSNLTHQQAKAWAKKLGGELPTRPVAAMLFANLKKLLREEWHSTADTQDASCAWSCSFFNGSQHPYHKTSEGSAVAVRLIQVTE